MIARLTRVLYGCGRACVRFRWPVIAAWIAVAVVPPPGRGERRRGLDRQPDAAGDRVDAAPPTCSRSGSRSRPTGASRSRFVDPHGTIGDSRQQGRDRQHREEPEGGAARDPGREPARPGRVGARQQGRQDRLHLGLARHRLGRHQRGRGARRCSTPPIRRRPPGSTSPSAATSARSSRSRRPESSEAIGLAAAVVILVFAFGTVTAMTLPIMTAIVGLIITLALVTLVGHATDVPNISPTLATMIGLGVGIDYALFIVTKHKLQLAEGMEMRESIARALRHGRRARSSSPGSPSRSRCARCSWPGSPSSRRSASPRPSPSSSRVLAADHAPAGAPRRARRADPLAAPSTSARTHPDDNEPHGWARMARAVGRRPWPALIGSVVLLLVLALPVLQLRLGQSGHERDAEVDHDPAVLRHDHGRVRGRHERPAPDRGQARLPGEPATRRRTRASPTSRAPSPRPRACSRSRRSPSTRTGRPRSSPPSRPRRPPPTRPRTWSTTCATRSSRRPSPAPALTAYVGGQTAGYIDLAEKIATKLPLMIAVVVLLSFVVLLLAFRSVVIPIKAAVMNLLSVARRLRRRDGRLPGGLGRRRRRAAARDPDRELRAAAHVRDPVRALDGLRGVPGEPDAGALPRVGRRQGGGRRRPGGDRAA